VVRAGRAPDKLRSDEQDSNEYLRLFRARKRSLYARLPPLSGIFFCRQQAFKAGIIVSHGVPTRHDSMLPPPLKTAGAMLGLVALLGACASPKPPPPKVNLGGFPPAFRDGYADGCQSAKPGVSKRRDDARFAQDAQYAMGWRDGYDICRKRPPP